MRDLPWSRTSQAAALGDRIWRYISPSLEIQHDPLPVVAALVGLTERDRAFLAWLHLVLSDEADALIRASPQLLRSLTTSTTAPLDVHPDRIRGPVDWAATLGLMGAIGRRLTYATRPVERDYATPENRMLFASLRVLRQAAAALHWDGSATGVGAVVATRQAQAAHLLASPVTRNVIGSPQPGDLRRVERGRASRRFAPVARFWRLHQQLNDLRDTDVLRALVEKTALIPATDGLLMELLTFFEVLTVMESFGWSHEDVGLFGGGVRIRLTRDRESMTLAYQAAPTPPSRYQDVLREHGLRASALRPDVLVHHTRADGTATLKVVEVKYRPSVATGIREALFECLGYLQNYADAPVMVTALGVAWGAELEPVTIHDVSLCTLEHLPSALSEYR